MFPQPRPSLTCADCGVLIVMNRGFGADNPLYRRLHFTLSDGSLAGISFCPDCATAVFTPERLEALDAQIKFMWKQDASESVYEQLYKNLNVVAVSTKAPQTWMELERLTVRM